MDKEGLENGVKFYCVVNTPESRAVWRKMTEQQKNAMNFIADKMNMSGLINLSGKNRYDMMMELNIKLGRFYQLIRQLRELNVIRKYGGGDYIVNPSLYFKGRASDIGRKMSIYNYKTENDERKD
ncbi:MAG: replication/maintenance protein RepL [Acutalibacteraceae bacterium]